MNKLAIWEIEFLPLPFAPKSIVGFYLLPQSGVSLGTFHDPREHLLMTVSLTLQGGETPIWRGMIWEPKLGDAWKEEDPLGGVGRGWGMVDKLALFGGLCWTTPLPNNSNQFTCQYTSSSQEGLVNGKYPSTHLTLNGSSLAPSASALPAAAAAASTGQTPPQRHAPDQASSARQQPAPPRVYAPPVFLFSSNGDSDPRH